MHASWNSSKHDIRDFVDWDKENKLVIQPDFQRKAVWNKTSKIMLIDTILKDYPIPKIFIQNASEDTGRTVRKIIDGQQRITAILEFTKNEFKLDEPYNGEYLGLSFIELPSDVQKKILRYAIDCNEAYGYSDEQYREIYTRLNKYTVPLNSQELRKAEFPGSFYKLSEEMASSSKLENWKVFTVASRRRLLDVEFVSEILAALLEGVQNKRDNLDEIYKKYKDADLSLLEGRFERIIDEINLLFPDDSIAKTRFKQKADFYSLVLAVDFFISQELTLEGKNLLPLRKDMAILDEYIGPSEYDVENSIFQEYAIRCLSSANTLNSRKWRINFLIMVLAGTYFTNEKFSQLILTYRSDKNLKKFLDFYNMNDPIYHDSGFCPLGDGGCAVCGEEFSFDSTKYTLCWRKDEPKQSSNMLFAHDTDKVDINFIKYKPNFSWLKDSDVNVTSEEDSVDLAKDDFIDDLFSDLENDKN